MNQEASTPRIKSIKVTGLFGLYEHQVSLKEERVTVMHGPNGVGKTVFLKLIDAFFHGRYHEMPDVPFGRFEVSFADGSVAGIVCECSIGSEWKLCLFFNSQTTIPESVTFERKKASAGGLQTDILGLRPQGLLTNQLLWTDVSSNLHTNEDNSNSLAAKLGLDTAKKTTELEPEGFRSLRERINVHLIEAQRLLRIADISNFKSYWDFSSNTRKAATNTVQEYSNDLQQRLEAVLADYAKQSQKLDQSFPQRLIHHAGTSKTLAELKASMTEIEATRSRLKKLGILDNDDTAQESSPLEVSQFDALQPEQVAVMAVYASDTTQKLAVLEDLAKRVEILLDVLNRKFINKKVSLSREDGLSITGRDGKAIPVNALSSGEQHEMVLLYDLLFKVKPNTLVLIDEPELSLHISWQKTFMDDLLAIIRVAQFDVLMATHSPYIVGDHSDLLVELSSGVDVSDAHA